MPDQQNWRTEVTAEDYFLHQKKQMQVADRRPVIRRASDIVGPGISANATRLLDFNNVLATYNGFYSAAPGAINSPDFDSDPDDWQAFVGTVSSDAELGGVQTFTGLDTAVVYQRVFKRSPSDASFLYWGIWVAIA